jgi:hypothetical protein
MNWVEKSSELSQGSIISGISWPNIKETEAPFGVVVSNACDFENDKLQFIIAAAIVPASDVLLNSKEFKSIIDNNNLSELSSRQQKKLDEYVRSFVNNNRFGRYYFFDIAPIFEKDDPIPMLIDFQHISSAPYPNEQIKTIGRICHPFVEQFIMCFSHYVSRIPSDRASKEQYELLKNKILFQN